MARTISSQEITAQSTVNRRTWRTEINSELGSQYTATFYRETVNLLDDEVVGIPVKSGSVNFSVSQNLSRPITAAGVTVSVGQLAALVAQLADELEEEAELAASPSTGE